MIINKVSFAKCVVGTGASLIAISVILSFLLTGYQLLMTYFVLLLYAVSIFPKVYATYKSNLHINDYGVSMSIGEELAISIKWEDISEVKYYGSRYLPVNDRLCIIARQGFITVDYNRKNYLLIWKLIINEITKRKNTVEIDNRLLQRIAVIDRK